MKIALFDKNNELVATVVYPDDRPMANVIMWGSRGFFPKEITKHRIGDGSTATWGAWEATIFQVHTEGELKAMTP